FVGFNPYDVPSPCYVLDRAYLRRNARILGRLQKDTNCRILLALKAFAAWQVFDDLKGNLAGTCASGLNEAKLATKHFGGEVHVFSPGFDSLTFPSILEIADHVSFNSLSQWQRFGSEALATEGPRVSCGLRINPQCRVAEHTIYDPSAPRSRFGILASEFGESLPPGVEGLHVHNLCEQSLDPLVKTVQAMERDFGHLLPSLQWLNLGGGHLLTRDDYEVSGLVQLLRRLQADYGIEIYLEPGEAVVDNAGVFVTTVLDVIERGPNSVAILDASATCHMPDVLEMPYRPALWDSWGEREQPHSYRIGGNTCLSGDFFGTYTFPEPLQVGQRLVFDNEAMYTMVKTSTFNGLPLPSIATWDSDTEELEVARTFGYEDYESRLS
ncbi:MAG: carboxynorspermidine decarboxylase, partial [Verrucomicrobiota bacterium]